MTETIESMATPIDQLQLAQQLVEQARAEGVELIGPGGLLTGLTKSVLETALEAPCSEVTDHPIPRSSRSCEIPRRALPLHDTVYYDGQPGPLAQIQKRALQDDQVDGVHRLSIQTKHPQANLRVFTMSCDIVRVAPMGFEPTLPP
jgi:hypothetical protein